MSFVIGSDGFIGSHMRAIRASGLICMAGISNTTEQDEGLLEEANVRWPIQLFGDALRAGLPFIYAGSASVYGNGEGPLNAYARSKMNLDAYMEHTAGDQVPWYGLRFFNVYGPGEAHKGKQASMPFQLLEQSKAGYCEIFAPTASRDFIHVDDVVSVAQWMLENRPPSGIYDVGTGVTRTFRDLANCFDADIRIIPMPASLYGKYQTRTQADLTKLRAAGYGKPFLSLEEGIKRMRDEIE